MATAKILLQPGSLWPAVLERTRLALDSGALHPIETRFDYLEQSGVRFLVRVARNLQRKNQDKHRQGAEAPATRREPNPFLAPERELRVADISDTHLALLNKFNVIDHHLLLVTRRYHDQDCLLDRADFEALSVCMAEFNALGFYNGGRAAGASQRHKHLQMIPLPMLREGPALPVAPLIESQDYARGITRLPTLAFPHAIARRNLTGQEDPVRAAAQTHQLYLGLLAALKIAPLSQSGELRHSAPYNLLITGQWMLVVPRVREHFGTISVNALGFAGSFFVRTEQEKEQIRKAGPWTVLQKVCPGD